MYNMYTYSLAQMHHIALAAGLAIRFDVISMVHVVNVLLDCQDHRTLPQSLQSSAETPVSKACPRV